MQLWENLLRTANPVGDSERAKISGTPHDIVYEEGGLRLLHYRGDRGVGYREPVLICYALVNRPYILDLQPAHSVIRRLLEQRLDVYLIDWGVPAESDHSKRLGDYVCGDLKNMVDFVCRISRSTQLNLLGYCMGGTMSAMVAALYPQQIRNLILMAAPIDFSGKEGLLNVWSDPQYFDVDGLIDSFGNCPGPLLQLCFQLTRPVQNFQEKYVTLLDKLDDEEFTHSFAAMERWANDSVPVAGETFRDFVTMLYQQNLLVQGKMKLLDRFVDLMQITCPLLLLTADHDHLVPPRSSRALAEQVASRDIKTMSSNCGHVGLAVSRRAHRDLWPAAAKWLADHSTSHPSCSTRQPTWPAICTHPVSIVKPTQSRSTTPMSDQNTLETLRQCSFFKDVSGDHLEALAKIARIVDFPARKTIFSEFDEAKDVYVIVSGEVSVVVCVPSVGCRQMASTGAGELLGWSPLLERGRLSATAVTQSPTKAIAINGHKLAELCHTDSALGYEFMARTAQVLAERLYATRVQLVELSGTHLPEIVLESD